MKEKYSHNEIRYVLRKWYDGTASPEEEHVLGDYFSKATDVAPDLETDRRVFEAIRDKKSEEMALPEAYEQRIIEVLEKEIAGDGKQGKRNLQPFLSWQRVRWALGGVAVMLAGVLITPLMMKEEKSAESGIVGERGLASISISLPDIDKEVDDTLRSVAKPLLAKAGLSSISRPAVAHDGERERSYSSDEGYLKVGGSKSSARVSVDSVSEYAKMEEAEERRLAARNYHVVRDAAEADRIMSGFISRLESNIEVEEARLSQIGLEFSRETGIVNNEAIEDNRNSYEIQPI